MIQSRHAAAESPGVRLDQGSRVAICGAGCAGLSAAVELVARVHGIHISIFDAAMGPAHDKTWCSWSVRPHRFASAVSKSWDRVRVRGGGYDTTIEASRYSYTCIRARDFFDQADRMLKGSCQIEWSSRVQHVNERDDAVELTISDSTGAERTAEFDIVLDGRTVTRAALLGSAGGETSEPRLVQHFGGLEVEVPRGTVDPNIAVLMDFDVDQGSGIHFMYALPLSEESVLVESTLLTPPGYAPVDYASNAFAYIEREFGVSSPTVTYREAGALPMTLSRLGPASSRRVWTIGTRAGIGRASSGYAFDAIQRDSARIVSALAAGEPRPGSPRSRFLSMLDRVLLSWLTTNPSVAPQIFGRLFARCPTESLIRFLADEPTAADLWNAMWAMPKLRTAVHASLHTTAWPRLSVPLVPSGTR
ncbi:MAG: lycopene cyclase family protein [Planctomycetota bacterium]